MASNTADGNGNARPSAATNAARAPSRRTPAFARASRSASSGTSLPTKSHACRRRDVESGPSVTAADFQETAGGGHRQGVAEGLRLRYGREAVQADFVPEDCALHPPRDLASRLGIPISESVDRIRLGHRPMIWG